MEGAVHDGGCVLQAHDLVFVLDRPGVLHHALPVDDLVAVLQQRQEDLRLGEVHADLDLVLVELVVGQHHVEVPQEPRVALPLLGQRALHGAVRWERVVRDPGAIELLGRDLRTEPENVRIPVAGHDRVAPHVIDLRRGDGRGGGVALVAGLEQDEAVHVELVHVLLDAAHAVLPHPVHVHPLLVVHLRHAMRADSHDVSLL